MLMSHLQGNNSTDLRSSIQTTHSGASPPLPISILLCVPEAELEEEEEEDISDGGNGIT